jgi:hypothetical protein
MSEQTEEREISFDEALAEESGIDQAGEQPQPPQASGIPAPPPPGPRQRPKSPEEMAEEAAASAKARAQAEEQMAILAPQTKPRKWSFGKAQNDEPIREYVQYPLSVITKTQWFSLAGEFLEKALGGDNPITLNTLLAPPEPLRQGGITSLQQFQDADTFVAAVGKLLIFAPEFMIKSICIWLAVPDYEWELAEMLMKQSPELGGLSDQMFEEIFSTFIDQNFADIDRFFRERIVRVRDRYLARAKEIEQSRSQKR